MTALSLQRTGAEVTVFFGSRSINAVHKEKIKELAEPDPAGFLPSGYTDKRREINDLHKQVLFLCCLDLQ